MKTTKVVKPIRDRADEEQLYETPIAVTEKMLDLAIEYGLLPNNTCFWEAAKGRGKMVEPIEARKYKCIATDLYHGTPSVDFLTAPVPDGVTAILTNFPFKNKAKFFERLAELGNNFICIYYYFIFKLYNIFFRTSIHFIGISGISCEYRLQQCNEGYGWGQCPYSEPNANISPRWGSCDSREDGRLRREHANLPKIH